MSGPSVVVERAPDGWTHIGGPGMHLLIGLDEDDERTLVASDAADGGDIDDVVEVLTAGGVRKAQHFVGVHWSPRTRVVAFGPVAALVTLADGSEHDVRAPSSKVWTDLELPEHPRRVVLRVLEESERSLPVPPQHLVAGLPDGLGETAAGAPAESGTEVQPETDQAVDPEAAAETAADPSNAPTDSTDSTAGPTVDGPAPVAAPIPAGGIPTFGATATTHSPDPAPGSGGSAWGRSWARRDDPGAPAAEGPVAVEIPAVPVDSVPQVTDEPAPQEDSPTAETLTSMPPPSSAQTAPALRSWGSLAPAAPVRATAPAPPPQRDVDSTWAARPVAPAPSAPPSPSAPATSSPSGSSGHLDEDDDESVASPSYDYLFGHTTAADEHRKVLAQLTQPEDEDGEHEDDDVLSVPAVADTSDAAVTNAAPAPEVPERPIASAPQVPEGGLISSVPWASPSPAAVPKPEAEVPTFSGRHTPPPAPSLLPPMNTPPPGVRAPEATPLISTGPPPVGTTQRALQHPPRPAPERVQEQVHEQVQEQQPDQWAHSAPQATPVLRTLPTVPIATTPPTIPATPPTGPAPQTATGTPPADDDDETELTVDRSALLEARNAAQSQTFSGPSVLAVLCSAGHPTPPHSDRCRVCGTSIPPQEPFTMPRPPLGVLRLSTGDVVTLDRSVLLGRAPKLGDGLAVHDRPHVVKVPSPERDVSRNHVEVILEGWHVLIRDLGTTNGTTVTLPGDSPVRLRANDQQVLEPGSLVSMADEISFTFEAAP